jgi:hypothetical protein
MRPPDQNAVLLKLDAAASRLSISERSVYTLIEQGRLKAKRLVLSTDGRGQLMVLASSVEEFAKSLPDAPA